MPPLTSDFDRDMQMLEAEIKRLEAEYNMFFAGRLPRLPWETRKRVETLVKQYDRMSSQNTAERFRFGTLQARFASFCDLWEKQVRAREEGRPIGGRPRRSGDAMPVAPLSPPRPDSPSARERPQRDGVLHELQLRDAAAQADRLQELYQQLADARAKNGEQQIPFTRFAEVVRAQIARHGADGADVTFRVTVKEGKVTLSAKAKGE